MEPQIDVSDHRRVNLANWNSRVRHHEAGYGLERFVDDGGHLSDVVRFDLPRLGDIAGLDGVHLQCHIGTDTLSLARLGARSVTGLDFSEPALHVARRLATDCGTDITYVAANVYDAVTVLDGQQFDRVYTGIGALCWLPDVRAWAQVVAALLRPGGELFIREGHPMLWTLCEPRPDQLLSVEFPYFETPHGTPFTSTTTYYSSPAYMPVPAPAQTATTYTTVSPGGTTTTTTYANPSVAYVPAPAYSATTIVTPRPCNPWDVPRAGVTTACPY